MRFEPVLTPGNIEYDMRGCPGRATYSVVVLRRIELRTKRPRLTEEWPEGCSLEEFQQLGWQIQPIREYVLKVHSRCNLACDYCYIYEMADTSWMDDAASMSVDVARGAAMRIAEHAERHQLSSVTLVLHGGEPLLLGERRLHQLLHTFESLISPITRPVFRMQTNGVLLTDSIMEILNGYDVGIGISLDGGREANNRHRKRRNGVGTFTVVSERIRALQSGPYGALFGGLLATVDVQNDPVQTYRDLRLFDPPRLDFLLPHGNWTTPPDHLPAGGATPYADWLSQVFDYWFHAPGKQPGIRMFDEIIRLLHGRPPRLETVGLAKVSVATITTSGAYELADSLKSTFDGAAATTMDVFRHTLDEVAVLPAVAARQVGEHALSDDCKRCPLRDVCGGGLFAHRYRAGEGFLNPSVYCDDLYKLITHVREAIDGNGPVTA